MSRYPILILFEGVVHSTHALKNLSVLSAIFFGTVTGIGCASLALKSWIPGLVLTLLALAWIKINYTVNYVALAALVLVGAAFLYVGIPLASISLIITGSIGLVVSYDLKQFSHNIFTMANNETLKNVTAVFSGWGIVGALKDSLQLGASNMASGFH